jgi:hypothetical protein
VPDNYSPGQPQNKSGRPRKVITAEHLRQIEVLAGYGLPEHKIARAIGVSPDTFWRNKKVRPEILVALERGSAVEDAKVARALVKKAESGNVPAIRWFEMTRCGRRAASDGTTGSQLMGNITAYLIQNAAGKLVEGGL